MWIAITEAQKFVESHKNAHITFVGHSKGGAEAEAMALATNRDAILFNPAKANYLLYGIDGNYDANMESYVVEGEVLSEVYNLIDFLPLGAVGSLVSTNPIDNFLTMTVPLAVNMSEYKGEVIPLYSDKSDRVERHGIDEVLSILRKEK